MKAVSVALSALALSMSVAASAQTIELKVGSSITISPDTVTTVTCDPSRVDPPKVTCFCEIEALFPSVTVKLVRVASLPDGNVVTSKVRGGITDDLVCRQMLSSAICK